MDSFDKFATWLIGCGTAIFLGMMAAMTYGAMLKHSCNLHGMQHSYDSAHIAQICGN